MATYAELQTSWQNSLLINRVEVAVAVAAVAVADELDTVPNHVNRLKWAKEAMGNLLGMANQFLPAVLAKNKALTLAQIEGATDANIQTQVDSLVNLFAQG